MLKNNVFLDEVAKLANGAAGTALEFKKEVEVVVQAKLDSMASRMQLVTREEFEVVQAMAQKAREENAVLSERLAALEEKLSKLEQ